MPSNHLILCHPLLLPQSLPASESSSEYTLRMRWPKDWSFSFSIIPSKEIPGLVSFRMDWLDLLAVQGTLKSLLQHHSSEASILQRSAFFTFQLSHPYMTTGKTIALTRRTFVASVMSNSATLWTVARQAPLSMRFSRQESWSGLPFPPPGDLPDLRIEPVTLMSLALAGGFFTISTTWEAQANNRKSKLKDII